MINTSRNIAGLVCAALLTVGCSAVSDIFTSSDNQETQELGLLSACRSIDSLVEQSPSYFPVAVAINESANDMDLRKENFRATSAALTATLATLPREEGPAQLLESLDSASAAAPTYTAKSREAGSTLEEFHDVEIWSVPLENWHSSAQQAAQGCVAGGYLESLPPLVEEGTDFFDLLPYGAWEYFPTQDDFGDERHSWVSAATTSRGSADGQLALFIVCWEDNVSVQPEAYSYRSLGDIFVPTGSRTQGVEIGFNGGSGVWTTFVGHGVTYGLFPDERSDDYFSDDDERSSKVSRDTIQGFVGAETVSISMEFVRGEVSGKNYVAGLEKVIDKMRHLGCWPQ